MILFDTVLVANRGEIALRIIREGVKTTVPLHRRILASPAFRAGAVHTRFLEGGL